MKRGAVINARASAGARLVGARIAVVATRARVRAAACSVEDLALSEAMLDLAEWSHKIAEKREAELAR